MHKKTGQAAKSSPGGDRKQQAAASSTSTTAPQYQDGEFLEVDSAQFQEFFKSVKDTLTKVKLPLGYKTDFSLRGVGRAHTSSAKLINNCCEYAETLMKFVLCLEVGQPITDDLINTLMTILAAQIKYLQSEKAVCFVNGKFGDNVGNLFREFKSHSSVFSAQDIQTLEHVAQLANTQSQNQSQRGRGRGGRGGYRGTNNYSNYGSGNRYSWRGGGFNRGHGGFYRGQSSQGGPESTQEASL